MPRAGPLRYWSLTLLGGVVLLACGAAFVWGTYGLIGTESCGTRTTQACSSDTALHILAVALAPFVAPLAVLAWALRGGGTKTVFHRFRRREKRLQDQIARGETHMPTVGRPAPAAPVPSLTPLNRTWPPATWEPQPPNGRPHTAEATPIERLLELDKLKAEGLITAEEHEAQKKRILGGI